MIVESRLIELFKELCLIDAPALAEADSVAYTKALLTSIGLEVWEDEAGKAIGGNANNLIARLPATNPDAPTIFLSAHFDTVEPTAGLEIEERDGVFYSSSDTILGADDKAGMAPAIEAVRALMESGAPHGTVYLLLSVAEEIGLLGAGALKIEELDIDFGYVLDTGPPVGTYVTRTATHDKLDVTIHGIPAHAGKDPEKGVNAIEVLADAVHGMKLGRIGPETTANIGIVHGGTGTNVVCAKVEVKAEARSTSTADLDAQVDHMIQRFEEAARNRGAKVEITHRREYLAYEVPADAPVVQIAAEVSREMGLEPTLRTTLGGSDANRYNAKGVPTIVMGTGMEKIHTHDEHVSRKDLVLMAELCFNLLKKVGTLSKSQVR
ncbi:MAG: M20/M25/M40 family metallo-hydrolase [Armatimonadetes bacterium]|nr:M20/M25/M40 family metallo-hydrolase [Armatimonadota bacterium]